MVAKFANTLVNTGDFYERRNLDKITKSAVAMLRIAKLVIYACVYVCVVGTDVSDNTRWSKLSEFSLTTILRKNLAT